MILLIGEIQYFLKHTLHLKNGDCQETVTYILAHVLWFKPLPNCRDYFGPPIQVCLQDYESYSSASFVPVAQISHSCASASIKYNLKTANGQERVVVVVPLERQFTM